MTDPRLTELFVGLKSVASGDSTTLPEDLARRTLGDVCAEIRTLLDAAIAREALRRPRGFYHNGEYWVAPE